MRPIPHRLMGTMPLAPPCPLMHRSLRGELLPFVQRGAARAGVKPKCIVADDA